MIELVYAVYPNKLIKEVEFVTNHVATKDIIEEFNQLQTLAIKPGKNRNTYDTKIKEWEQRNEQHIDLMFQAINAAHSTAIAEKLKVLENGNCCIT